MRREVLDGSAEPRPGFEHPDRRGWWRWRAGLLLGRGRSARRAVLVDRYTTLHQGRPEIARLGRTWIARGRGYWARRLLWSLVYFLIAAVMTMLFGVALAKTWLAGLPWPASAAITAVGAAAAAGAFLPMWWKLETDGFDSLTGRSGPGGWGGPSQAAGRLLAPLLLPFLLPVLAGLTAAMFLATLRRAFPGEGPARAAMREYGAARPAKRRRR
jgi:hypothetical protein